MSKRLSELSAELIKNEVDYKKLDGISALVMHRYEIDNSVSLALVIYSNLIGFGLTATEDEAVKVVTELISNYDSFQLRELAISLLSEEVVDHYKSLIEYDYQILAGPLASMLKKMDSDLDKVMEELSEKQESLEKLVPRKSQ